jgi:hypothetical protein
MIPDVKVSGLRLLINAPEEAPVHAAYLDLTENPQALLPK